MSSQGYEMAAVLEKLAGSGKLSPDDKNWVAAQLNKQHERNIEYKLMDIFARDPDFKLFLGMASGFGIAGIMGLLQGGKATSENEVPEDNAWINSVLLSSPIGLIADWAATGTTPLDTAIGAWYSTAILGSPIGMIAVNLGQDVDTIPGAIGQILGLASAGFGGMCAMILILKAIFSGTDLGEMAQALTSAIPFT